MPVNTKAIKRRMKSVTNTKKITKAMELVSASKMRRAVEAALATRAYAAMARDLMKNLSQAESEMMPLLVNRPVKNILLILVTSNRGLCGSFNANVFKRTAALLAELKKEFPEHALDVIGIGKKSAWFAKKFGLNLIGVYENLGDRPGAEQVLPISSLAISKFTEAAYDRVFVSFTEYQSSLSQVPATRQLLPVSAVELEKAGSIQFPPPGRGNGRGLQSDPSAPSDDNTLFEPSQSEVLATILPRLVEVQLYHAILESGASEHSARMVAMKNATEAASDMLSELRLSFNKARQAAITQEISEIVGGAAALSS